MDLWKMPPPIKVFEAIGAIGDGRVRALDNGAQANRWEVASSDGSKNYTVELSADGREISSNDNASYWQKYLGYPAIAALIACGKVRVSAASSDALAGIRWKEINRAFRNHYERTLDEVARIVGERGADFESVRAEAGTILEELAGLGLTRGVRRRPPRERI